MRNSMESFRKAGKAAVWQSLLVLLVLPLFGWGQDQAPDARSFADSVVTMFDQGKYSEMYDLFDSNSRQMTREQWIQMAGTLARQRGRMISRSLGNSTKSMGTYRFIFNTKCSEGKVYEDVSVFYKNGEWRLFGFWVKPNLD
jgi:hypothetical protein